MNKFLLKYVGSGLLILFIGVLISFLPRKEAGRALDEVEKINGMSLVGPPKPFEAEKIKPIRDLGSNYLAIIPYAFTPRDQSTIQHGSQWQWWGEVEEGVIASIDYARAHDLKVMVKPHVWVLGQGWAGDFELKTSEDWDDWSKTYFEYILKYATLSEEMGVEIFCIGTEYRNLVQEKPEIWLDLIKEVRKVYSGEVTYAANWDNYQNVDFWDELDYIGIDAYFPINDQQTPEIQQLIKDWETDKKKIQEIAIRYEKPLLFTEYGYESIDYAADGHWKHKKDTLAVNYIAQQNSYSALYETFWDEPWFAGGFIWKWHVQDTRYSDNREKRYTPQDKPVLEVIRNRYNQ